MIEARPLPLSQAAQVLGIMSIPLAFAGQLVVPAFLMGVIAFGLGRWNANKDLSFVPIRVERVVEVTFGQLESGRFRHGVQFVRWRPDRTPESCRYEQLDVASPGRFEDLLAERG